MGASSSTSATEVTLDKKVVADYKKQHDATLQELRSVKNQIVKLQEELRDKQMKFNSESNLKNGLQNEISIIKGNLLEIMGEKAKLSGDLAVTKLNLNELQIKYYNLLKIKNDTTSNKRSEDTDTTIRQFRLVKTRVDKLSTRVNDNLEKDLQDKQMKLNIESNLKNALQNEVSVIRMNLRKTQEENGTLSKKLETTQCDLNQLQIEYNFLSKTNDNISKECNTYRLKSEDTDKQLEQTMVKLIQTKSDLEKVSQQLSEEIENNKNNLELEKKYRSLEESNNKLEKDLRANQDELVKMKTAFIECINENQALEKRCKVYEADVGKLNGDLSEIKLELNNIKLENKKLQTSNTSLSNELKELNKNRSILKQEISKKERAITKYKNTMMELEDELHRYNSEYSEVKEKLTKTDVTDETLRKVIQIYGRIQELQRGISAKLDVLKNTRENDRDEKEKLLENLKLDYENCEKKLELKSIIINRTHFTDIYAKYKLLCQRNDDNKTNLFKQVYEIEKFTKDLQKRFDIFSKNLSKDVEKIGKSETYLNTNLLMQGFTTEQELYRDVLKIAKEEIMFREKCLQIDEGASKSKDCNILNNGKPNNFSPPTAQTLQDANNTEDSKGVILFGVPYTNESDHEDRLMISMFLEKNGLDYGIFKNRRFRKDKNGKRPLVIEFTNGEIVKKIMELGQQKNWFLGFNPAVQVYVHNRQK